MRRNDGFQYQGFFENNKQKGLGILKCQNGDFYEGSFKENSFHGYGVFVCNNGEQIWGFWENDEPNGEVWIQLSDGTAYGEEYEKGKLIKSYKSNQKDSFLRRFMGLFLKLESNSFPSLESIFWQKMTRRFLFEC